MNIKDGTTNALAERCGQLDPQSLAVQSVDVLIGSPSLIAGKLPLSFDKLRRTTSVHDEISVKRFETEKMPGLQT
ncbi:MAG: hypothetical protein JSS49_27885 [Planctomycetes bacterium]|nr:hypothetical protein [Planctomycetota bacterium]